MEIYLNKREKEILELWKNEGEPQKIAKKLEVSVHTVKAYLSKFRKLNLI